MDWFQKLKIQIVSLNIISISLLEEILTIPKVNPWILKDINLEESYVHLKEISLIIQQELESLVKEINQLERKNCFFFIEDLKTEYEYILENMNLQLSYLNNMALYMSIVDDYTLPESVLKERWEQYLDNDISCFNQVKINHEQLKQLRKERRDYFE